MYPYHGDLATPGGLAASTFLSACQIKYNKEKSDVLMATSCHSYELFMLWFCHCKYWKDPNRTDCALFLEDRHPSFYHLPERPVVREATFSTHPTFSAVSFDNSWLWQKVIANRYHSTHNHLGRANRWRHSSFVTATTTDSFTYHWKMEKINTYFPNNAPSLELFSIIIHYYCFFNYIKNSSVQ